MPCFGASKEQIREVRAGDQQHEGDGRLQYPDRAAGAAKDLLLEGFDLQDVATILR